MPKKPKALTPIEIKLLTRPGLYTVGEVPGLQFRVAPGGSRGWVLRYSMGRRKHMGLGGYPGVTLAGAREKARAAKALIDQGIDPVEQRKAKTAAEALAQGRSVTFQVAAGRCHAKKSDEFRNAKHSSEWLKTLERYAFPVIGALPVGDIGKAEVLKVLEPIWRTKTETATRVRQRMENVFSWAIASDLRTRENPARWKGNLDELLSTPSKLKVVRHFPAVPWKEMAAFMADLRQREGVAAKALEFAILTAARSGEVRGMRWEEVDKAAKVWTIPPERTKNKREHRVPLSGDALAVLEAIERQDGNDLVFSATRGGVLSDVTLLAVMRRMGLTAVPHGFRSSFKDWARNCTSYPDEVSELALAHVSDDKTRAAYARDELLPQREKLMKEWAKYCRAAPIKGNVVAIRRKKV